jgi:hypothetical protein
MIMATVGTLIFEMAANTARLQQDMAKAQSTVKTAMDSIGSAVNTAKAAIAALGVTIGAHEFVAFVESGIESVAMLGRLSESTGLAVETLSALRSVAAASHTSLDTVAAMVAKLDKNMLDFAQNGTGKAAKAFATLGYTQDQVRDGLKNMDSFLPEFAQRLIASGEGGETVGLAMQLIGKGASAALPFLYALAAAHELAGTRTQEQSDRAKALQAEMAKVSERTLLMKEDFAIGLTPALMQTVEAFNKLRERGQGAVQLGETLGTVMRYAAFAAGSLWIELRAVGEGIGAVIAMADELLHGNVAGAKAIFAARAEDVQNTIATLGALKESLLVTQEMKTPTEIVTQSMKDRVAAAQAHVKELEKQAAFEDLLTKNAIKRNEMTAAADYVGSIGTQAKQTDDIARQLGLTFSSAFEDAIVKGRSFRDVLQGIEQDIARIIIRKSITEPIAAKIAAGASGMDWGSLFGGGRAEGGTVSPGMSYLVGEHGPEVLTMGANSGAITPNGGGGTYYIDNRGADAAAVARLEATLRQVNASIEYRAVGAMQRAFNERGATTPMG